MNKDNLKKLPLLVESMDENLSILLTDFINHPLFVEFKLNKDKFIDMLKQSKKFVWDFRTGHIKFKEKADRNILIVGNFVHSEEEKEAKIEEMKNIIKNINRSFISRIKQIDQFGNALHIIFDHEDVSMDIEKNLNVDISNKVIFFKLEI